MLTKDEELGLATMAGGAAVERFDAELKKILKAMSDPNTAVKKHSVTLTATLTPNENDDFFRIDILVQARPAPVKSLTTSALLGRGPRPVAHEIAPKQATLFGATVTPMERKESK